MLSRRLNPKNRRGRTRHAHYRYYRRLSWCCYRYQNCCRWCCPLTTAMTGILINRAAGTRSRAPATGATTATRATTTGTLGRESRRYNALRTPSGDSKGSR